MSYIFNSAGIFSPTTLNLPVSTSPAQTGEGQPVWDSDDDVLTIGTGASRKTLVDLTATQTLSGKTLTAPVIADFTNAAHDHGDADDGGALTGTHAITLSTAAQPNITSLGTLTSLTTSGTATIRHATSTSLLIIDPATAGQQGQISFRDANVSKWQLVKTGSNTLVIYDEAAAVNTMVIATGSGPVFTGISRVTGGALNLGTAGSSLGVLAFNGNTSGTITVQSAAAAGTWTWTLPPDDGDAGEQLQTNGSGVSTWEAAASTREVKNIIGLLDPHEALKSVVNMPVERWFYKRGIRGVGGDYDTEFAGGVADNAPWLMKDNGKHFNPINAFGYSAAAIQALAAEIRELKAQRTGG